MDHPFKDFPLSALNHTASSVNGVLCIGKTSAHNLKSLQIKFYYFDSNMSLSPRRMS